MTVVAAPTATSTPPLSSPGIGSGLNVTSIVSQLMAAAQGPLNQLQTTQATYQTQLSSLGTLKSALSQLQSAASSLGSPSLFQNFAVGSSATSVLTGSASSSASTGSYNVQVNTLASAQSLVAAGQASATTPIGSGTPTTISFQFGTISGGTLANGSYSGATFTADPSRSTGTVTIDTSNNTLTGIAAAINNANLGVQATLINDGSAAPQRLVLTSTTAGANSAMKISVSGDATLSSLLSEDPAGTQDFTQATAGVDAQLSVNGVAISSHTNAVTGAVGGVTLNLAGTGSSTLSITRDSSGVSSAVQAFVTAYNGIVSTISNVAGYNATTQAGGPLLGDFGVQSMQSQLANVLDSALPGLAAGGPQSLADVGVTLQQDGTLAFDSSKLASAISTNPTQVSQIFAAAGSTTDPLVSFSGSGATSTAGTYAVDISQLATQATVTGSAPAGLTITPGVNDQLTVNVNGTAAGITLAAGTYTAASLAAAVQSGINGTSALAGSANPVTVTASPSGVLTMNSGTYGSASTLTATGTAAATLFGTAPTVAAGTDVSGTIGGYSATGSGQTLTGGLGGPTAGIALAVTGGSTGARGVVNFSQGVASQINALAGGFLSTSGTIANETSGINAELTDIAGQITDENSQLSDLQARYTAQFSSLDTLLATMQSTQAALTQELAGLTGSTSTTSTPSYSSNLAKTTG